jgi:hypothetical protein
MAIINNVNEVLHRIRAKLYPNYLHGIDGAYIARTDDEASLSIEEVCAALKNRGGFTGNYQDLVEYVRQFFDEAGQKATPFGLGVCANANSMRNIPWSFAASKTLMQSGAKDEGCRAFGGQHGEPDSGDSAGAGGGTMAG